MYSFSKNYPTSRYLFLFLLYTVWAFLLFLFTKYCFGNFYEVYEFIHPATLSGSLTDSVPVSFISPIALFGLGEIYRKLYLTYPGFAWYDYGSATQIILSSALIFYSIHMLLKQYLSRLKILLYNTVVFFLFISETIVNWNCTRTAFLACIASFIFWISYQTTHLNSKLNWVSFVITALFFAVGIADRPEVGELLLLLIFIYFLCFPKIETKSILGFLPFLIPSFLIIGSIYYSTRSSTEFYDLLDPVTEYEIGVGNMVDVHQMKTIEDSMKFVALQSGILNDPQQISYAFVMRLVMPFPSGYFNFFSLSRALNILREIVCQHYPSILINVGVFLFVFYFLLGNARWRFRYLLFNLLFGLIIFGITYFMTMEGRLFAPLMFFYACAMILPTFQISILSLSSKNNWMKLTSISFLLICGVLWFLRMNTTIKKYENDISKNRVVYEQLKKQTANKIIAPDANAFMVIFFNNFLPFQTPDFTIFKKIFLIDIESLSLKPAYRNFLDTNCICNSTNLGEFYDFLYAHKNEVVFTGSVERFKLFETYLQLVHHRPYRFHVISALPNGASTETSRLFTFQFD